MKLNGVITFSIKSVNQNVLSLCFPLECLCKDRFRVFAGTVVGVVIYTGRETRSVMNTSNPKNKVG